MPKKAKTTINDLLNELQQTIAVRGEEATAALLRNGRQTVSENEHLQFIIITVCNCLSITIDQLLSEKNDTTKYAKGFIVFYLRNEFKVGWVVIKSLLKLNNQSWLWELMQLVTNLKPKLPVHVTWLKTKETLDARIKEYKQKK